MDDELALYVSWLAAEHPRDIDFVVLYGSRARGTHRPHSDYDILIGLSHETQLSFRDRLYAFNPFETPHIEAKPYTPSELEEMWFRYQRTVLDPLFEGRVLVDNGAWARYQTRYQRTIARGVLERDGTAWIWHKAREPEDSRRLEEDRRLRALPFVLPGQDADPAATSSV